MERYHMHGEFMLDSAVINEVAQLGFATGKVGQRYPLDTDEQRAEFAREESANIVPLTKPNTADCGDERLTLSMADGTADPALIRNRITPQLFGGLGLATTKALVAANAVIIRDAKDMWGAYLTVSELLSDMGEEDAGHGECGASLSVEKSVANKIDFSILLPSVGLFVPDMGANEPLLRKNLAAKEVKLLDGFFSEWSNDAHEAYLREKFPQNFSNLLIDHNDHETFGHNGSGMLVVTGDNQGYQKSGHAFSVTLPKMRELAYRLGGSDEERQRILLGFADDTLHVGGGIVTEGFPVFAQIS